MLLVELKKQPPQDKPPADFVRGARQVAQVVARNAEPEWLGVVSIAPGAMIMLGDRALQAVEAERRRLKADTKGHLFKIGRHYWFFNQPARGFMFTDVELPAAHAVQQVVRDRLGKRISLEVIAGEAGVGPALGLALTAAQAAKPLPLYSIHKETVGLLQRSPHPSSAGRPRAAREDIAVLDGETLIANLQAADTALAKRRGLLAVDVQDLR